MKSKNKSGQPPKYTSVADMSRDIDAYFDMCEEKELPFTITGLAMALDMDRSTIINYSRKEEYFGTIKRARMRVENDLEVALRGNNVTGTIFNLKNNFGWKDKTEQEITAKVRVKAGMGAFYKEVGEDNEPA